VITLAIWHVEGADIEDANAVVATGMNLFSPNTDSIADPFDGDTKDAMLGELPAVEVHHTENGAIARAASRSLRDLYIVSIVSSTRRIGKELYDQFDVSCQTIEYLDKAVEK
jgi:hypothetical protein